MKTMKKCFAIYTCPAWDSCTYYEELPTDDWESRDGNRFSHCVETEDEAIQFRLEFHAKAITLD
jgi:hypothetical protein